ncbi:MAG: LysR family transcriptional regulator [Rhizobiaceae bacterium]|nr:LysR family transcriptional regulator [Rhizobiaceae bacterium]
MQDVNLRSVDLNLLSSLEVLLEECDLTKAADRLNISQPTMSRTFARLRDTFRDPLLVRNAGGYVRTVRAEWLQSQLLEPLDIIRGTLATPVFEPSEETGMFKIASLDYGEIVLVPTLVRLLKETAPSVGLELVQRQMYSTHEVEKHTADVSIGVKPKDSSNKCIIEPLIHDRYVCVMGKNHPLADKELTLESYLAYGHSIISTFTDQITINENALRTLGLKRRIDRKSPNFVAAHYSLNQTQLLLTSTARVANELVNWQDLVVKELPFEMEPIVIYLIWHVRDDRFARHRWFREQIKRAASLLKPIDQIM